MLVFVFYFSLFEFSAAILEKGLLHVDVMVIFKYEGGATLLTVYLTNRFQVAVHLFTYRSQMTSKCGKNRKVAHKT